MDRLSEFAFLGKKAADAEEIIEPNKIPDGAIAGIVIGGAFGALLIGLLIFFLLKRGKKEADATSKDVPETESQETAVIVAAPIVSEHQTVGFYRITKDEESECTFTLYYEEGDKLSKEMGIFESENAAYKAIKHLREIAAGAKAENRVRNTEESIPAPKFILDVDAKGVYRYSFLDEEGTVLLQSVQYRSERRCLDDLKKTLICVTTEEVDVASGALASETIEEVAAEAPVEEVTETVAETTVEEVAATEIADEEPTLEESTEAAAEEILAEETPVEESPSENEPAEETSAENKRAEETPAEQEPVAEESVEERAEKEEEGSSLEESFAIARETVTHSYVDKQYAAEYLAQVYGDDVACELRKNRTKTGLPLADTHYAVREEGEVCFAYVYQIGGTTMMLVKVDDDCGKALAEKHPLVKKSAFPKSKDSWYSVIVDDTFTSEEIEQLLDAAYDMAK